MVSGALRLVADQQDLQREEMTDIGEEMLSRLSKEADCRLVNRRLNSLRGLVSPHIVQVLSCILVTLNCEMATI